MNTVVRLPFLTAEPPLAEVRREVLRDAKTTLEELEQGGGAESRGRLLGLLDVLALLVRIEPRELDEP